MTGYSFPNDPLEKPRGKTLADSNNTIGAIAGNSQFVNLTFTLDTAVYASGDVLADRQAITNAMREKNRTGILHTLVLIDQDDQKQALDIVLLSADVTLGTENAAVSISDINAENILGIIPVATTDYNDLGGVSVATKTNLGLLVRPVQDTRNIFVGLVSKGTGTYTASGLKARFAFIQD